jgi:tol-pal system protein YbgF
MALLTAMFLLVGLPSCTWVKSLSKPEEDPQIVALQHELNRLAELNSATRQKMEDVYEGVLALQARVDSLEADLDELAEQRELQAQAQVTVPSPEVLTPNAEDKPTETEIKVKQTPEDLEGPAAKLKKTSVSPKLSPERQYEKAFEAYTKQHFDEAMALFKKFVQDYPQHDLADNAQYWIGETYYDMEDYPNAILAFKEVVKRYPERSKASDALLKIGCSYVALDDRENARIYLEKVIKNYPFSEAEAKAQAKLTELENL